MRYIKDANVRRLQQLQETAAEAFTTHVSRHKAEIAARHSYFQEKFPLLRKTVLDDRPAPPPTPEEEIDIPEMKGEEDWRGLTADIVPPEPVETAERDAPEEQTAPPADPDPMATRRAERAERRRLRTLRRQKTPPRHLPPAASAAPAQPKEASPDAMTKPPTPPPPQERENHISTEEMKVLMEIEKFENLRRIKNTAPAARPASPSEAEATPVSIPPTGSTPLPERTEPERAEKRKPERFSLRHLFDLSPKFRDMNAEDEDSS